MEENKHPQPPYMEEEYDEIDIMELLRKLLKDWKLVLKWAGVAAVVGLVIAFSLPQVFTVNSKLAPEVVSRSGGGSLAPWRGWAGSILGP